MAVTKYRDQGNLQKKAFNGGLQFQRWVCAHCGGKFGSKQAGIVLEQ